MYIGLFHYMLGQYHIEILRDMAMALGLGGRCSMNMRDRKMIPPTITRNRARGGYKLKLVLEANAITKSKSNDLQMAVNTCIRELGLVGVVSLVAITGAGDLYDAAI